MKIVQTLKGERMSDKRFELDRIGIFDNKTNHFYYKIFDEEEVVDLLNELSEENEQLKNQLEQIPPKVREIWLK